MSKSVATGLLALILLATYSNHFQNSFHFDDAHTIVNNAAIRELKNIPLFFKDARSFSSLPSNQSYRPLVSTMLAIDYAVGGLNPVAYHVSIFALFLALVLLLVFVLKHLLDQTASSSTNAWIAFAAAALYGLHPANADTVNYIIASAEIISTLGVVASFTVYFAFPNLRGYYLYVLPVAVAILAKPPAAIFPILFAVYRALFSNGARLRHRQWDGEALHSSAATKQNWLIEVAPIFVACAAALFFVQWMTPHTWVAGARNAHNYLITQPYVALLYFKTFLWPEDLSADYDLEPFTSINDPRFVAGSVFVAGLIAISILCARSKPGRVISFGLLWFLIALLPTSLFPLAEVMNDHRTFLPYIGLVIAIAGAIAFVCSRVAARRAHATRRVAATISAIALLVLCASAYATFQRNKVWRTEETLWRDVTIKSPNNSRGLMNYGNTLMAKGDFHGALDYFHRALTLAPQYSVLFVNMAIAEDAMQQTALAEQHFKEAMRFAPFSPDSYTFYGRYLLAHARPQEAETMIRSALSLSPTDVTAAELFAQIDRQNTKTPEHYLALSLQKYSEGKYEESIAAAQSALTLKPDYAEAFNNICAASNKLGRYQEAANACEQALRIKPDFDLARNNLQYARERSTSTSR
ncbi:MAG TPA: tetratricopeptide repeat protein [Chthoniobacterales bacterium]|nr:tetratricopeptide repeat protein [Chthoniobacterales bacterium]